MGMIYRLEIKMKLFSHFSGLVGSLILVCCVMPKATFAQSVRTDGSLSTTVSTSDNLNFTIEAGDRANNNLFHSFSEFSLPTAGSATFLNAADITNIISRVTGNTLSNITYPTLTDAFKQTAAQVYF